MKCVLLSLLAVLFLSHSSYAFDCTKELSPDLLGMTPREINKKFAQARYAEYFENIESESGFSPNSEGRAKAYIVAGVMREKGPLAFEDQPEIANAVAGVGFRHLNGYYTATALESIDITSKNYDPGPSVDQLIRDMEKVGVVLDLEQKTALAALGREVLAGYNAKRVMPFILSDDGSARPVPLIISTSVKVDWRFESFVDLFTVTYWLMRSQASAAAAKRPGAIRAFGQLLKFQNAKELRDALQTAVLQKLEK